MLSWPSWLTCSGRLTHIIGHPSAAGRAQDRETSPTRDRRSTTVPRHQLPKLVIINTKNCSLSIVLTATDQKTAKIIEKVILRTITLPECQHDAE